MVRYYLHHTPICARANVREQSERQRINWLKRLERENAYRLVSASVDGRAGIVVDCPLELPMTS
jgi:23S rRNA G2069 N7-methylase RlmK/C1962 C5-methylase RlmI